VKNTQYIFKKLFFLSGAAVVLSVTFAYGMTSSEEAATTKKYISTPIKTETDVNTKNVEMKERPREEEEDCDSISELMKEIHDELDKKIKEKIDFNLTVRSEDSEDIKKIKQTLSRDLKNRDARFEKLASNSDDADPKAPLLSAKERYFLLAKLELDDQDEYFRKRNMSEDGEGISLPIVEIDKDGRRAQSEENIWLNALQYSRNFKDRSQKEEIFSSWRSSSSSSSSSSSNSK
jgi:hypothetical protein